MMSTPRGIGQSIPDPSENGSLSPMVLFRAAFVRWPSALALALFLGGSLGAAVFVMFPPEYTATAMLRFRFNDYLIINEGTNNNNNKEDIENQQRTQVALVRSQKILEKASSTDPRVYPPGKLSKDVKAGFSEGTSIMYINMTGPEAEPLSKSVNAIADAFLELAADNERQEMMDKQNQLDDAIKKSEVSIMTKKEANQKDILDARPDDPKNKAIEAEYLSNSIEYTRMNLEKEKRTGSIKRLKDRLKNVDTVAVERSALEERLEQLPAVAEAMTTLGKLEATESDIRSRFNSATETPAVLKAADATKRQRELVQKLKVDMLSKAEATYRRQIRTELTSALGKEEEELLSLESSLKNLSKQITTLADKMGGKMSPSFELKIKEIEQDEEVLKALRNRRERLKVETNSGGSKVSIFSKADTPSSPNYRSQYSKVGVSAIAGLLLGWFSIGFLETRSRRVRDGRILAAHTGLRILGAIPSGVPAGMGLLRPDDISLTVSADLLRTSLQLDERLRSRRTLVVTSASEGEGKSTLAMLLAGSFARAGFRTLLVDADLRNPSLTNRLGVIARPGLSESLTYGLVSRPKTKAEEDGIGEIEELDGLPLGLIQAGADGQVAAMRLARADLRSWFASLRKHWEYIIIDTPPVLPVPDAAFLSKASDGVVLCARAGVSRVEQVHTAAEHVASLGIDCLGIVLNDVQGSRPNYYGSGRVEQISLSPPALLAPTGSKS